jgi:methionyl-tRNA synthetase
VDFFAGRFQGLKSALDLSFDAFVRTTSLHHVSAAQALWKRCAMNGDIYKKKYRGLYCIGDEAFLRENDLIDGKCPNHAAMDLITIEEENYFFRLSAYARRLLQYLARPDSVLPSWRREEAIRFVEAGLEDFSISREKARMHWGVPVPGDDDQVMYVWFDALTNYISTLGWPDDPEGDFEKFWRNGNVVQVAGKDQVRFQSIMWQAMLMSGQIKNTDTVMYHGFVTSRGQKMSKSLGNVIEPLALTRDYGIDALRLFLARHTHPFEDSDFTMERFRDAYNADLANGLGNLAANNATRANSFAGSGATTAQTVAAGIPGCYGKIRDQKGG